MKPITTKSLSSIAGLKNKERLSTDAVNKVRDEAVELVETFMKQPDVQRRQSETGYVFYRSTPTKTEKVHFEKGRLTGDEFLPNWDSKIEFKSTSCARKHGLKVTQSEFTLNAYPSTLLTISDFNSSGSQIAEATVSQPDTKGVATFTVAEKFPEQSVYAPAPYRYPTESKGTENDCESDLEAQARRQSDNKRLEAYYSTIPILSPPGPGLSGE